MYAKKKLDQNDRRDLAIIAELVSPGESVLDLGCGEGHFLRELRKEKQVRVLGVEIDQDSIVRCIGNGVPVIQRDLNDPLDFAPEGSFDLVVLSQTLQETKRPDLLLSRLVRLGRKAAVSVINFGHLRCRMQVAFKGCMPRSPQMPFQWYDTPNIHFCTLRDFRELCEKLNIEIVASYPISPRHPFLVRFFPNLFASSCVFVLEKRPERG